MAGGGCIAGQSSLVDVDVAALAIVRLDPWLWEQSDSAIIKVELCWRRSQHVSDAIGALSLQASTVGDISRRGTNIYMETFSLSAPGASDAMGFSLSRVSFSESLPSSPSCFLPRTAPALRPGTPPTTSNLGGNELGHDKALPTPTVSFPRYWLVSRAIPHRPRWEPPPQGSRDTSSPGRRGPLDSC